MKIERLFKLIISNKEAEVKRLLNEFSEFLFVYTIFCVRAWNNQYLLLYSLGEGKQRGGHKPKDLRLALR